MDWCKAFMWIASICAFTALFFERFLPQIVVATLAFVGIAIQNNYEVLLDERDYFHDMVLSMDKKLEEGK